MESPHISLLISENDQHNTNKDITVQFLINSSVVCYFLLNYYLTTNNDKKLSPETYQQIQSPIQYQKYFSCYLWIERTF